MSPARRPIPPATKRMAAHSRTGPNVTRATNTRMRSVPALAAMNTSGLDP